ncbi:MAG: hypothetical protein NT048_08510 [Flavobacterium sp.]|nr:hypothetical protein [Flavobacterium sp.]
MKTLTKIYILFIVMFFYPNLFYSQDLITKKTGDIIKVKVLEVTTSEIKYKKIDNLSGPTYSVTKSDVFSINYKNGTKDVFSETISKDQKNENEVNADTGIENNLYIHNFEISEEVEVNLPNKDVYYNKISKIDEVLYCDDFELELSRYDNDAYEYFPDLNKYISEMATSYKYKGYSDFAEKEISSNLTCKFSRCISQNNTKKIKCFTYFGVIQDSTSKVLYEFNLFCYNPKIDAKSILESIKIINN